MGTVPALAPVPLPLAPPTPLVNDPYTAETQKAIYDLLNKLDILVGYHPPSEKIELITAMLEVMLNDALTPLYQKSAYVRTVVKNKLKQFDQSVQNLNMSYNTALRFSNSMTALRARIYAIEMTK
jgi:hypothetical protein